MSKSIIDSIFKAIFSLFSVAAQPRPQIPIITEAMFDPPDQPITTVKAKQLYRKVLKEVNHGDAEDIALCVDSFAEEMKYETELLAGQIKDTQDEIKPLKNTIAALQKNLKTCTDEYDEEDIKSKIEEAKDEIEVYTAQLKEEQAELTSFKEDKKKFLIDSLNAELHER